MARVGYIIELFIDRLDFFFIRIYLFSPQQIQNLFSDGFEVAQFSTNLRGNPQVVDRAGFEYSKHKGAWRCLRKSISDGRPCSARITTNGYQIVKRTGFHDHPAMYGLHGNMK